MAERLKLDLVRTFVWSSSLLNQKAHKARINQIYGHYNHLLSEHSVPEIYKIVPTLDLSEKETLR